MHPYREDSQVPFDRFFSRMCDPPREFGMIPFWLWNDDLDEEELIRQLHAFHAGGLGGVIILPFVGLSEKVSYLSDSYFQLVRRVVDECAVLGLKVILYDEGGYPSGSACGQVVAVDPGYAARALILTRREITGPWYGYWRPSVGRGLLNRLVCVVLAKVEAGVVQPESLRVLDTMERNLVHLDLGAGTWQVMACFDVPSGGHIRGVLPEHEDSTATAPPAGDIMNPEAVATFIRLTHDAYARHLRDHLGTTVVGLFTDEPTPMGRGARGDGRPYTRGFERWLADHLEQDVDSVRAWLPSLWVDYGPQTEWFRQAYARGVHERVTEVFYGAQTKWCEEHGIALTGHPHMSNDMTSLSAFGWPGQDMVWRWVLPGNDSGLVGPDSVAPKAATSAARANRRRRIGSELFGAYGWILSLDEVKWLLDWHLSRGNNLFMPSALYYSVREGRAYESEPDLALHNVWWPHFQHLAGYTARMSWLLTNCEHVCDVAVLGNGYDLPWEAARYLYENQIDFLYIDDHALQGACVVDGRLHIGSQAYQLVVLDGEPILSPESRANLRVFTEAGGTVLSYQQGVDLVAEARRILPAGVTVEPAAPGLRTMHLRREGLDIYAFFNEGEAPVQGQLCVGVQGIAQWWDPLRLTRELVADRAGVLGPGAVLTSGDSPGLQVPIVLERRESRLLIVDTSADGQKSSERQRGTTGSASEWLSIEVTGPWDVADLEGNPIDAPALGDWTTKRQLERFSGTFVYQATVSLSPPALGNATTIELDLGRVGEAATVLVNGKEIGWALWAPYRIVTGKDAWVPGDNVLEVRVTNTAANAYEGALYPSGLMGPVRLLLAVPRS
jgi:hypothetical protein